MDAKAQARGRKRAQRAIPAERCERCGTTEGRRLSRHHKDGNPLNNERSNVAILCLSCHTTTHWEEGYRPRKKAKVCVICAAMFEYRHSTNKTCSRECLSEFGRRNQAKRKSHGNRYTIPQGPSLVSYQRTSGPSSGSPATPDSSPEAAASPAKDTPPSSEPDREAA